MTTTRTKQGKRAPGNMVRVWSGRFALVLAPFVLLGLAEALMRWVDPAPVDPRWKDPYIRPLVDDEGEAVRDSQGRALLSNEPMTAHWAGDNVGQRSFAAERRDGVARVFSIGASTTFALKYAPRASYTRFLSARLSERLGEGAVEVVNLGISGYDSVDLPRLTRELLEYEPDLLIVYAGHNELKYPNLARVLDPTATAVAETMRRSALLWRLLEEPPEPAVPPELTSEPLLDPDRFARSLEFYSEALLTIVESARAQGVEVLLCVPASNVRDKLPRQSALPVDGEAALRRRLEQLKELLHPERELPTEVAVLDAGLVEAEALCQEAPEASLAHYLRGRLLFALRRTEEARSAFERSRELDRLPERAWPALTRELREVAARTGAVLVDVEARIHSEAEGGTPGFDLFFDYCHPNLRGHWCIADELLAVIQREELLGDAKLLGAPESETTFEQWCERFGVDESMGTIQQARQFLGFAALREGDERERLLAVVEEFLNAVLRDPASESPIRAEAWTLQAIVAVMRGRHDRSVDSLRRAGELDESVRRGVLLRMVRNAFFRDRFEALGLFVEPDGRWREESP